MSKIRLMMVDHTSSIGGAERSMLDMIKYLDKETYDVEVVIPNSGPLVQEITSLGVPVSFCAIESWRFDITLFKDRIKFFFSWPLHIVSLFRWIRFYKQKKPEIIHCNINRVYAPILAAAWCKIPVIVHFRDVPSLRYYRSAFGLPFMFWVFNKASIWIANSEVTYQDVAPKSITPRVVKMYNGFDVQAFDARKMERSPVSIEKKQGVFTLVVVATIVELKNHKDIIHALNLLKDRKDWELWVVGTGNYEHQLINVITEAGLLDRVKMLGFVENIPSLLSRADILLHTSLKESFGRVYVEAMLASLPVVTYDIPVAKEVLKNNETARIVPVGSVEKLAASIEDLLDHPDFMKQMGSKGRSFAESHFSMNRMISDLDKIYNSLL